VSDSERVSKTSAVLLGAGAAGITSSAVLLWLGTAEWSDYGALVEFCISVTLLVSGVISVINQDLNKP
jgi:hypothetical protein